MAVTRDVTGMHRSGANAFSANGSIKINNVIILDDLSGHTLWARPDRTIKQENRKESMWTFLLIIAVISLIIFWKGPNAVWGGIALGAIGGLIIAIIISILDKGFHWSTVGKGIIVGVLLGVGAELLGKLSDRMRKKL